MSNVAFLYTTGSSYYSMIARLTLTEKHIPFNKKNVDIHAKLEQFSPDYVKLNPHITIPTLVYKDTVVTSSHDILFFVDQLAQDPVLQPKNPQSLARMNELINLHYAIPIENFTMGKLLKNPLLYRLVTKILKKEINICKSNSEQHPELKTAYGDKEKIIEERMTDFDKINLLATYTKGKDLIMQFLNKLNENLNTCAWAACNDYSLADIVCTCILARIEFSNESDLYKSKPRLNQYYEKLKQRPSFQAADIWPKMRVSKVISMLWNNLPLLLTS